MRNSLFVLLAAALLPFAQACSASDGNADSDEAAQTSRGCAVVDAQKGGKADLSGDDSAFARLVLANKTVTKCPTTFTSALAALKSKVPHPERQSTFGVDETANTPNAGGHRFVVSIDTGDAPVVGNGTGSAGDNTTRVWMAALEGTPATGGAAQLDESFIEVIAFSPSRQANVFYKFFDGSWHLMGDGTQANPATSTSDKKFFCRNCHASGALNFKELELPWNNWNSARFEMPKPTKMVGTMKTLMNDLGDAYVLEKMISGGNRDLVKARVAAVLAGKRPDESAKTLLRHVMCDLGEPTLASSQAAMQPHALDNDDPASIFVPNAVFEQLERGGRGSVMVSRSAYKAALTKGKQTVGGKAGDTMFAFFVPERSFVDDAVGDELVAAGVLDAGLLLDLRMTDFTNPVFSAQRCALADTAPDGVATADALRKAWIPILQRSKLAGAAGLAKRLATPDDDAAHEQAIADYVARCVARGASATDGPAFVDDLLRLSSQRRRAFEATFPAINESPALIPQDKLGGAANALHMHPDCTVSNVESEIAE
jgi:hypothetical protein